eukprot:457924_1
MNGFTSALQAGGITDVAAVMNYLQENDYDTDSVVEDVLNESSFLHRFCQNELQNSALFHELKRIVNRYIKYTKSNTFKDMDYGLSKYYELMGYKLNDYYTEKGIGKFEIYCCNDKDDYYRFTIKKIAGSLNRPADRCRISEFDIAHFPVKQTMRFRAKRFVIQKVLSHCWENKYWYDKPQHVQQYYDIIYSCKTIHSCIAIQNIGKALQFHAKQHDSSTVYQYFNHKYKHLVKDFHHIMVHHLNTHNKSLNDKNFETVTNIMCHCVKCNIEKCNPFTRNNRDREDSKMNDDLEMEYYTDLLDNIHCYFLHSYDTGFRVNPGLFDDIYNEHSVDEKELDIDANDIEQIYVDNTIKKLKDFLSTKKKKITAIRSETNKFVTQMDEHTETSIKKQFKQNINNVSNNDTDNIDRGYSFGCRFYYWNWFKNNTQFDAQKFGTKLSDWYAYQKYKDFKHEMLSHINVEEFNLVKLKATNLLNQSNILKKLKCNFRYFAIDTASQANKTHYGIKCGEALRVSNIMSLLFYTDYSKLSYHFSKTFRKIHVSETIYSLKKRNSYYFHWSKILRETVELYGTPIGESNIDVFYHGVSFLHFDKFVTSFYSPTSTTKQLAVATIFSDSKGIVLELVQCMGTFNKLLTYFDCSIISAFGNEDEKLFFGGGPVIQFKSIRLMETNQDMRYF